MRSLIQKAWSNEFFKGGVFLTMSSFVLNIFNYFFNFIAGRSLGPSGFGEITALFSYVYIISVPLSVLSVITIQKISSTKFDPLNYTLTLEDFFWGRIKKWWFCLIPFLFLLPFIPRITNLSPITAIILIPYLLLSFMATFYGAAIQGLRLFQFILLTTAIASIFKLTGAILSIFTSNGLILILIFILISILLPFLMTVFYIHKKVKVAKQIEKGAIEKGTIEKRLTSIVLSKHVIITTLSVLGLTLFNNIDVIFVKKFFSPIDAGLYSSWSLFAKIILYFVSPLASISFIFFASKQNKQNEQKALQFSLLVLLFISIGSLIIYTIFSPFIISGFFGQKFNNVIPYLWQASLFGSFYTAIFFLNNFFLAKKSNYSLILPFCIPIYAILLFFIQKHLSHIFILNIVFSIVVTIIYLIAWRIFLHYNKTHGS